MTHQTVSPLRIFHAVRAPVGGIFRHILDLANGQIERGHQVGILADSLAGGARATAALAEIAPRLALGVHRMPICREPSPRDIVSLIRFGRLCRKLQPDILHGHGAQAGAFVRMQRASAGRLKVYTPHGGSLHYAPDTLKGMIFSRFERALMNRTNLFLFESAFARDTYFRVVGKPQGLVRCVFNGVSAREFDPITIADDATDLVYVGEFRRIKGTDLLIDALALLRDGGRRLTLTLADDGEETDALQRQVATLGLHDQIRFIGHVDPRVGFSKGRLLVVPSRGDSMPYVVIEAGAAGQPMIAARIGGIPEIFGPHHEALFAANNPTAMADAISDALESPQKTMDRTRELRMRIFSDFSQTSMVEGVLKSYSDALGAC